MPKLQLKQSLAVLIALLHCHVANQALLLPHARTLVEALAAMLQALALERTHDTSQGAKNTGAAAEDQLAPSLQFTEAAELLAKRPTQPQRSALSAELEGQAAADHSSVSKIDNVGSSTSALTSSLRQAQMQQSASPQHAVQQSAAEDQTAGSPSGAQQDLTMVSELKQACYSLLLFLPAAELQGREQFWMQHAAGLPFLLRCCLAAAITFEPRVSHSLQTLCSQDMSKL